MCYGNNVIFFLQINSSKTIKRCTLILPSVRRLDSEFPVTYHEIASLNDVMRGISSSGVLRKGESNPAHHHLRHHSTRLSIHPVAGEAWLATVQERRSLVAFHSCQMLPSLQLRKVDSSTQCSPAVGHCRISYKKVSNLLSILVNKSLQAFLESRNKCLQVSFDWVVH